MKYRWIEDIKEFRNIAREWDEAISLSGEDNPFLLSDFILTWWKYYYKDKELLIYAVYDKGRIIAGIPLCMLKKGLRKTIVYPGGPAANVTHFFTADKELNIVDHLLLSLGQKKDWDNIILERVLSIHPLIGQLEKCAVSGPDKFGIAIHETGMNGIIDLKGGYDTATENLGKRLRRYLRTCKEKAGEIGELRLEKIESPAGVSQLFTEYRTLSVDSFRMRKGVSAFEDDNYSNFFGELFEVFGKKGMLDAHRLTAGKETLGISFGYRFCKGFKWVLTAFNPLHQKLRPGHLLIDALVREAIKNGDAYFDMYYGGELFYKQEWCNKMIPIKRIQIYRNNPFNKFLAWAEKGLRSNAFVMDSAKKARNLVRGIRYEKK